MGRIKDRNFWESARYNSTGFMQYYNRLTELAISMFEWKNLPDTVDPRFMELALFGDGMAVFFKDDVMGFLCLRCMIGGQWNVYQIPTIRTAYASNGYNMQLTPENSVIIFNNMIHTNSTLEVETFSRRLWDLDRIIDVNAKAQKTPILIQCDETERLVMKNLYMKYEGNEPFIFGDRSLNPNSLKVLKTDAPYIADKINDLKHEIWSEALTFLGISNIDTDKRERLIVSEVEKGQGATVSSRYSRLVSRQNACKEINRMFGLNIQCEYREDLDFSDNETADEKRLEEVDG